MARTLGAARAGTPFVAFTDDDSWWAPGDLARAVELMRAHPRLGLLSARILVGPEDELDPVCTEMAASPLGTEPDLPGPSLLGFVACAALVRTDAFTAAGGFDPVVRFPGEEERLALDLAAAGWGLAYVHEVVVHHHPSTSRDTDEVRQAGIWRSRVLTALMRYPARDLAVQLVRTLRAGGDRLAGPGRRTPPRPGRAALPPGAAPARDGRRPGAGPVTAELAQPLPTATGPDPRVAVVVITHQRRDGCCSRCSGCAGCPSSRTSSSWTTAPPTAPPTPCARSTRGSS